VIGLPEQGDASGREVAAAASPARIFIYGMNYAPEPIGVGRYTGEIGAYLVNQGHQVEVVTAAPHYPGWSVKPPFSNSFSVERAPGLRVYRCPLALHRDMRGFWRLLAPLTFAFTSAPVAAWRILTIRPDTVLCIEPTLFSAPIALVAAKLVKARTVLHVQDLEIDAAFAVGHLTGGWLKAVARMYERFTVRRFEAVVTISEEMRCRLRFMGVRQERSVVIRNWVDLTRIRPTPGPNRFRLQLGLTNEHLLALYAGNLGPKQALQVVLDAAERLVDRPEVVFVIAGEGPELARLEARSLPNVRFLPLQPEALLAELLAAADVHLLPQDAGAADLVLPSKLGGMLASGKALLVQADEGSELYRFLSGAAIIVPAGDADALAGAIRAWKPDSPRSAQRRQDLALEMSAATILPRFRKVLAV
jgi:colanic acid biosynthesis glycosyl transferase WcaI